MTTALLDHPHIDDDLTRRRLLAAGGTAALGFGLAGCGALPPPDQATGSSATTRAVYTTIHGRVNVPISPSRVVAINFPEAMALLDLGITPVGLPTYLPELPGYADLIRDVPRVDQGGSLSLELVAGLAPDLILGSDFASETDRPAGGRPLPYDELSAIAPTALFEWTMAAGNWRNEAVSTATAVGRTGRLDELTAIYADRCSAIRIAHDATLAASRWDIVEVGPNGQWVLYSPESSHGRVAAEAGLRRAAGADATDNFVSYSAERFGLLDRADALLVRADPTAADTALPHASGFDSVAAVRAGHAYPAQWFFPAGYRAALALLDELDAALTAYTRSNP